jgi:hypothetical protein
MPQPSCTPAPARLPRLALSLLLLPVAAAQDAAYQRALTAFAKLPAARQQAVAREWQASLPPEAVLQHTQGLRAASTSAAPASPKAAASRGPAGKRTAAKAPFFDCFLQRVAYEHAYGVLAPAPAPTGPMPRATFELLAPLGHAYHGALPDCDRIVAALLQRLDRDPSARAFAALLARWTNDGEPFYEALDRTAGTGDSVFYADAMLDDFSKCFGKAHPELKRSKPATQQALHRAFLAYRQYRGLREAIAWSVVLPPDQPLPPALRRYEVAPAGCYSVRDLVTMVLLACEDNPLRLVDLVVEAAPPLPQPLWSADHEPVKALQQVFAGLQDRMLTTHASTDAYLAAALQRRRQLAAAMHQATARALGLPATAAPIASTAKKLS